MVFTRAVRLLETFVIRVFSGQQLRWHAFPIATRASHENFRPDGGATIAVKTAGFRAERKVPFLYAPANTGRGFSPASIRPCNDM